MQPQGINREDDCRTIYLLSYWFIIIILYYYIILLLLFIYFYFILLFLVTKLAHLSESFIIICHLVFEHYLCIKFPTATNEFICSQIQHFMSPTQ